MRTRAKRLPRLWCALQGLLPLETGWAAQRGELAWSAEPAAPTSDSENTDRVSGRSGGNGIAVVGQARDGGVDGTI